jgi:hypothetical protein
MIQAAAPAFIARRALWALWINALLGFGMSVLTIANIAHQFQNEGPLLVSAGFAFIALFFLYQAAMQIRNRQPVIEIGPAGLRVAGVSEDIMPWSRVVQVRGVNGFLGLAGGRVDFTVDMETFTRLKFGYRFMGDPVVKKRGIPNTFSVITPQLEESPGRIVEAVKRYWSPPRADED